MGLSGRNVGEEVKEFYNKSPFPDYDISKFKNKESLEILTYPFAKIMDRSIPQDAKIIDIGTGTGQLSAFLSLKRKEVWGVDFSDTSLNKAKLLKKNLKLNSLNLEKIDITSKEQIETFIKKNGKFDYVLCLGVLHHTENAYRSFENILNFLKPGGYIGIGLYNRIGRIPLKIRKLLANNFLKDSQKVKDFFIKMQISELDDKDRLKGWWNDQYLHVHETTHTLGEVLKWFKDKNISFLQTVPTSNLTGKNDLEISGIFEKNIENYPHFPLRLLSEISWIWKTNREGGYWITFGKLENKYGGN